LYFLKICHQSAFQNSAV